MFLPPYLRGGRVDGVAGHLAVDPYVTTIWYLLLALLTLTVSSVSEVPTHIFSRYVPSCLSVCMSLIVRADRFPIPPFLPSSLLHSLSLLCDPFNIRTSRHITRLTHPHVRSLSA